MQFFVLIHDIKYDHTWSFVYYLTHLMPLISFDTPENTRRSYFLMFSGGIKRDQWHEMG